MQAFYLDRPMNFAHRGASHEAPANTLAAFLLAAELGADGIELDVHLSKDGELVVIHDYELETTTDGHGPVRAKTLAELKRLDAGGWFDPVFAGQRIPTLQEVIDAIGDRLLLNIELKSQRLRDDGLAAAVVRCVEENHLQNRVVVSSFKPLAIRRVKQLNRSIPTGLLYDATMALHLRRAWLRFWIGADALHPDYKMVDERYIRWAKAQGFRVNVWTADDPGEQWRLMRWGVDAIITNRPDLLRRVLLAGLGRWRVRGTRLLAPPEPRPR